MCTGTTTLESSPRASAILRSERDSNTTLGKLRAAEGSKWYVQYILYSISIVEQLRPFDLTTDPPAQAQAPGAESRGTHDESQREKKKKKSEE